MYTALLTSITDSYFGDALFAAVVLIVTLIVSMFLKKLIDLIFRGVKSRNLSSHFVSKTRTIRGLLKNILDIVFLIISVLVILSHWGVDIRPVLAGAGIVGLAISFGSQTLIKDLLSGIFIITEDQFNIGDTVKIGDHIGKVEKFTLRITVLRNKENNLIYIPNSQILNVVRFTSV